MEYRRFDNAIVARIDKGEEILEELKALVAKEHIRTASVEAIAGLQELEFGTYDPALQQYHPHRLSGFFEVISLLGNVTEREGQPYLHLHISVADESGGVQGGHLTRAVVGATCEMVIRPIDGAVGRRHVAVTGLNLFDFA